MENGDIMKKAAKENAPRQLRYFLTLGKRFYKDVKKYDKEPLPFRKEAHDLYFSVFPDRKISLTLAQRLVVQEHGYRNWEVFLDDSPIEAQKKIDYTSENNLSMVRKLYYKKEGVS